VTALVRAQGRLLRVVRVSSAYIRGFPLRFFEGALLPHRSGCVPVPSTRSELEVSFTLPDVGGDSRHTGKGRQKAPAGGGVESGGAGAGDEALSCDRGGGLPQQRGASN
jgi:hypothetical protein